MKTNLIWVVEQSRGGAFVAQRTLLTYGSNPTLPAMPPGALGTELFMVFWNSIIKFNLNTVTA